MSGHLFEDRNNLQWAPDGLSAVYVGPNPAPARIVAVDGGWVYLDDGTVWAAGNGGWVPVMPPVPGTAAARQRETAG